RCIQHRPQCPAFGRTPSCVHYRASQTQPDTRRHTDRREIKLTSHRMRKTKNRIFAIPAAAPAMPIKPSSPAMIAMTRKTRVQCSMLPPARLSAIQPPNTFLFSLVPSTASVGQVGNLRPIVNRPKPSQPKGPARLPIARRMPSRPTWKHLVQECMRHGALVPAAPLIPAHSCEKSALAEQQVACQKFCPKPVTASRIVVVEAPEQTVFRHTEGGCHQISSQHRCLDVPVRCRIPYVDDKIAGVQLHVL